MPNAAPTSKALSDQEIFAARLKRYTKEELVCVGAVVVLLTVIFADHISVYLVIGVFATIFRLAYLHVQRKKLIARGPSKSKQDWWDEWDERKTL
jgi:hypothetical protein